jgi:hypothetical protein
MTAGRPGLEPGDDTIEQDCTKMNESAQQLVKPIPLTEEDELLNPEAIEQLSLIQGGFASHLPRATH